MSSDIVVAATLRYYIWLYRNNKCFRATGLDYHQIVSQIAYGFHFSLGRHVARKEEVPSSSSFL